jgi:hypothetical protein
MNPVLALITQGVVAVDLTDNKPAATNPTIIIAAITRLGSATGVPRNRRTPTDTSPVSISKRFRNVLQVTPRGRDYLKANTDSGETSLESQKPRLTAVQVSDLVSIKKGDAMRKPWWR